MPTPMLKRRQLLRTHRKLLAFVTCYGLFALIQKNFIAKPIELKAGSNIDEALSNATTTTPSQASPDTGKWDSSKSVVLGLATGYPLNVYKIFVGSLRATRFSGHIILGISKDTDEEILNYLTAEKVTTYIVEFGENCTYIGEEWYNRRGKRKNNYFTQCLKDYPDWKVTWGRFALYKDWLAACTECTDGVILTDIRDVYFQRDPFQVVKPDQQKPLMVFEETLELDNTAFLTEFPVRTCKGVGVGPTPMLCSGSTMGSRQGILDYIEVMMEEFDEWKTKTHCRFREGGDDQSIHNYLYYANRFKNVIAIPHRTGPLHVLGYQAARIFEEAQKTNFVRNDTTAEWQEWLPENHAELLDGKTGMIVNMDGSPSAYVHQYDRFGPLIENWFQVMEEKKWPFNVEQV